MRVHVDFGCLFDRGLILEVRGGASVCAGDWGASGSGLRDWQAPHSGGALRGHRACRGEGRVWILGA